MAPKTAPAGSEAKMSAGKLANAISVIESTVHDADLDWEDFCREKDELEEPVDEDGHEVTLPMWAVKELLAATLDGRPEVRAFAALMEAKLRANDHKPGWKGDHPEDLLARLHEEADEIRRSWDHWRGTAWPREQLAPIIGRECADVANFAMMIADVCGALDPGRKALEAGRG